MEYQNSKSNRVRGGSVYGWALAVSLAIVATISSPHAEASDRGAKVKNIFTETEVIFESISSISRGSIEGHALSSYQTKGKEYSNGVLARSWPEMAKLKRVRARSLPDHCVTLAARAMDSQNVMFVVVARAYERKDRNQRGYQEMPPLEASEDIGDLVACRLEAGSIGVAHPIILHESEK